MPRALVYFIPVAMTVYGLIDLARSEPSERGGIRRWVWFFILLVPVLGTVSWLVVSRSQRARTPSAPPRRQDGDRRSPAGSRMPSWDRRRGSLAPDDDPEFLWRLEQQRRRADRQARPDAGGNRRATDATPEATPDVEPDEPGPEATPPQPE